MMNWGVGNGNGRVEHVERVEGESGELTDWEILTQRRRDAECAESFSLVERVEGERVSQGAPSLRDGAKKGECSHQ